MGFIVRVFRHLGLHTESLPPTSPLVCCFRVLDQTVSTAESGVVTVSFSTGSAASYVDTDSVPEVLVRVHDVS